MDEVIGGVRQIVVDDVCDVLHVNTARRDVGCDKDAMLAVGEALERRRPLRLGAITVDHVRIVAELFELLRDAIRAVLGAREDKEGAFMLLQHLVEQTGLLILHDGIDHELHTIARL